MADIARPISTPVKQPRGFRNIDIIDMSQLQMKWIRKFSANAADTNILNVVIDEFDWFRIVWFRYQTLIGLVATGANFNLGFYGVEGAEAASNTVIGDIVGNNLVYDDNWGYIAKDALSLIQLTVHGHDNGQAVFQDNSNSTSTVAALGHNEPGAFLVFNRSTILPRNHIFKGTTTLSFGRPFGYLPAGVNVGDQNYARLALCIQGVSKNQT